jgi:hypothetical protein
VKKILLMLLVLCCSACSESPILYGTNITFSIPSGYTLLTQQEVKSNWPFVNSTMKTYGNSARKSAISIKLEQIDISHMPLDSARVAFQEYYHSMVHGIKFNESKIITLNGSKWIYLELVFDADGVNVLNAFLIQPHDKSSVIINFNATSNEHVPKADEFLKFAESIKNQAKEGANKQVISSQADSPIKISRSCGVFFPQTPRTSLF